jgi:hypothetical protein
LELRLYDVRETVADYRLIDHSAPNSATIGTLGTKVLTIGSFTPFLAVGYGWKSLFDGTITDVKSRMTCSHSNAQFESVVILYNSRYFIVADHI